MTDTHSSATDFDGYKRFLRNTRRCAKRAAARAARYKAAVGLVPETERTKAVARSLEFMAASWRQHVEENAREVEARRRGVKPPSLPAVASPTQNAEVAGPRAVKNTIGASPHPLHGFVARPGVFGLRAAARWLRRGGGPCGEWLPGQLSPFAVMRPRRQVPGGCIPRRGPAVKGKTKETKEAESTSTGSPEHVTRAIETMRLGGAGPSKPVALFSGHPSEIEEELGVWKEKGVSEESVRQLADKDLAACLAAYIINYKCDKGERFSKMKEMLENSDIYGEMLADADEEEKKTLVTVVMNALAEATKEDDIGLTKMRVEKFLSFSDQ